ncbi:MAG: DUF4065 domain-containing protein [Synergistaceae bacterium]|nr:DUF4065 domain-containing protein [Synergistaceae bacterium]
MYDALDVARHIVNYCNEKNYSISNLKLQKLLYFVQAYFLIASPNKERCFRDEIQAWDFGPVVPNVYSEFKQFGGTNIPKISVYYDSSLGSFYADPIQFKDDKIAKNDQELIDEVIEKFKLYTASDLVKLTHAQTPWQDAYARGYSKEIKVEAIRDYFAGE